MEYWTPELGLILTDQPRTVCERKRVLVVEDDPSMQLVLANLFRTIDSDIEISTASSVTEALRDLEIQVEDHGIELIPYDLVVADILLEGRGTGIDLSRRFTEQYPDMPLIFLSSMPAGEFAAAMGESEITAHLISKPIDPRETAEIFRTLLGVA